MVAAALASLKGPKHGGANIKVVEMMADLKRHVRDLKDEDEIAAYLLQPAQPQRPLTKRGSSMDGATPYTA